MKTEIIKLNVDQYGLQESKAKEIESLLSSEGDNYKVEYKYPF